MSKSNMSLKECNICDYVSPTASYLKIHIDAVHIGIKHKCDLCNQEFGAKGNLDRHKLTIHNKKDIFCGQCSFKTTNKYSLKKHTSKVHEKIIKYACKSCEKEFTCSKHLSRHTNGVHLMIKMSAKITENKYVFNCVNYNDEKIDPFFTFCAGPDDHYHILHENCMI